ncbi:MAG: hypothetical protein IKZ41_06690 [Clostridia bacterium]|nr:hypothetical protein [Clostridia bacterium]MBR5365116.1 hypothetical protein [Clostridia bacterium]
MYRDEIQAFVETFLRREKRDRMRYLLGNPRKRRAGLDRFCHETMDLIDREKILLEGADLERRDEFRRFLAAHGAPVIVFSPDAYPEGERMSVRDALAFALTGLDAVLILGEGYAVIFGEPMKGGRDKVLLAAEKGDRADR